ncbi:MAG: GNAT family N-acetyltransferase [Dysgonamonadaceae bacterium]|jgi:GNAT superfamily N-acetyltransferase|nr:GNAT family N-acetyltransferase [Dysgonamonadaceae bacterium]
MTVEGRTQFIPTLKAMWKLCFPDDSGSFVDFYFSRVYKNEDTLIELYDNEPVASMQIIPYLLKTGNETFKAGYVSGAMTHPDFRKRGLMETLMNTAFQKKTEQGFDYLFLIPQEKRLFKYYSKLGFQTLDIQKDAEIKDISNLEAIKNKILPINFAEQAFGLYQLYFSLLSAIHDVVLKSEEQFRQILLDFYCGGGLLFACKQGLAFANNTDNKAFINELLCRDDDAKNSLLNSVGDYFKTAQIQVFGGRRGMIVRLNPKAPEIKSLYINMMLD